MSEIEQAEAALRVALAIPDVAAAIADYARENLGGLDVVRRGRLSRPAAVCATCKSLRATHRCRPHSANALATKHRRIPTEPAAGGLFVVTTNPQPETLTSNDL
jgi:hypothetical protein